MRLQPPVGSRLCVNFAASMAKTAAHTCSDSTQTDRRQLDEADEECLYCHIIPLQVEVEEPEPDETRFDCLLGGDDYDEEEDELDDTLYSIELPENFLSEHFAKLAAGYVTICIPGGQAVRSADGQAEILIPENAAISFVLGGREDFEHEHVPGMNMTRSVLVVRVVGDNGAEQPPESRDRLAGAVFGLGNDLATFNNSMRAQYSRCSFGLLNFVPADGPLISNGVMDVPLNFSLQQRNILLLRNVLREETARLLGVSSLRARVDHVLFCVAPGTGHGATLSRWLAFAHIGGRDSYFNSERGRCDKLSALMHEMGHNFELRHSGSTRARDQYGDSTGVVGISCSQITLTTYELNFVTSASIADGIWVSDGFQVNDTSPWLTLFA